MKNFKKIIKNIWERIKKYVFGGIIGAIIMLVIITSNFLTDTTYHVELYKDTSILYVGLPCIDYRITIKLDNAEENPHRSITDLRGE